MEGKTGMILGMFPGSYPETKITLKAGRFSHFVYRRY